MTATLTALIELGVEHGFGIAILVIGAQVLLDRLMPVEHIVGHLFGARRSGPAPGAHRRVRESRPSTASRFASSIAGNRNQGVGCTE